MNFIEIAAIAACKGLDDVVNLLKNVVTLFQWGIPMVLIIFGLIDLGKAVVAGKEDEMKKAQGALIRRFIYAIAAFLIVTLVTFAMGLVGSTDWEKCWGSVGKAEVVEVE